MFFFGVFCVGWILFRLWYASYDLKTVMAELDRSDPGWRLNDLEANRKVVTDAENSALQILAVGKLRAGQWVFTPAMEKMVDDLPPQVQFNAQQTAHLDKRLAILGKTVIEARKLKDMPEGRFPINYSDDFIGTLVPHWEELREGSELLRWDAARRVHVGDSEGALQSCLAMLNTARSLGDEPFFVSLLVRCDCLTFALETLERTLAQGSATVQSEPTLKQIQEILAKELTEPTLLYVQRGERAGLHQLMGVLSEGKFNVASYKARGKTLHLLEAMSQTKSKKMSLGNEIDATVAEYFPSYYSLQHAAVLRFATEKVEAAKLPPEKREERFQALEKKTEEEPNLVRILAMRPFAVKMRAREHRRQTDLRCALAAVAFERFRIAQNRWPDSIEHLVKAGFLDAIPVDPYNGKPVRLRRTPDGLEVYFVEPKKNENNGPSTRGRPLDPETDWSFRLWDISRRRQPPDPPVPEEVENK